MDRRTVLALGVATFAGLATSAAGETTFDETKLSTGSDENVPLWPGTPPGGEGVHLETRITELSPDPSVRHNRLVRNVATPLISVFRPDKPDGSAILLIPGGGYSVIVMDGEGVRNARLLNGSGVTAFVLRYRLPGDGWADAKDVPLQDAQRAMRLIRANAKKYAIDPTRLGVIGFSAGGHIAASLATRFDAKVYDPIDDADKLDARPDFAGLIYPVITMGEGAHGGSRDQLLGKDPSVALEAAYSCEKLVTPAMPPCFVALAADDPVVPPMQNGFAMFQALFAAKVPAELHVFQKGNHGFFVGYVGSVWLDLFLRWARSDGFAPDGNAAPD